MGVTFNIESVQDDSKYIWMNSITRYTPFVEDEIGDEIGIIRY